MVMKVVIADPKTGLTVQKEIGDDVSKSLFGLKIGDAVKGELVNLQGYEFSLTGGSDYCGFPMRRDVAGMGRKKILAYEGVGIHKGKRGMLQRKTVCGNTVHAKIVQLNLKVSKAGAEDIFVAVRQKKAESAAGAAAAEAKPAQVPAQ